ncbi:MAG: tetratricopeptide repeat protein, partial [Myxococcales bacterium]
MNSNASFRIVAVVCAALLAACPRPQQGSIDPLREASEAAASGSGNARERALAGHAAYLLESKPAEAQALWKRALEKKEDVWALYGLSESARRSLDTRGRVLSALRICAVEPEHPLCSVAARIASDSLGESPALDRDIEKAALAALAKGARGDAAFLLRLTAARARRNRGDDEGANAMFAEAGVVDRALLLGPYSAFHYLEWDTAFPPERSELGGEGPLGPIVPRQASAPDGHFALWGEATAADVYYWASDVIVPADGVYQARASGKGTFEVFVDGASAFERRGFEAWLPESMVVDVPLTAGRHRFAVKVARGTERGDLWLALSRADGKPAGLVFSAAHGAFEAPPPLFAKATSAWETAAALAEALEPEAGRVLADFVAARDAMRRDDQGARALADELAEKHPSAALLTLRGEAMLADPSLPRRTASGRARRDFERALALDPNEASVLQRLSAHARNEGRLDEAAEYLERARAAASPKSWRVLMSELRLAEARGMDALGQDAARRALALEPGLCDATKLLYELARRHEAVFEADRRLDELSGCPGHLGRKAEHLRHRGDLAGARALFERLSAQTPLLPGPRQEAARLASALGTPAEAAAVWSALSRMWPHSAAFHKRRAEALEQAGDKAGARAAREAALRLDGSDLKLRRAIAAEDGTEVLADLAEDGRAWIERYKAARPPEDAPGVYVLDASAIEAHPDGSLTERTHVVAKVLDQRGVSLLAEVNLPAGAEILALRTLKRDGRILEPEAIGGKDSI